MLAALGIDDKLSDHEKAILETYKDKQDTFASHQLRVKSYATQLATDFVLGLEVFIVVAVLTRMLAEVFWRIRRSTASVTSAGKFLNATESDKW
jgi:hypothetical protein